MSEDIIKPQNEMIWDLRGKISKTKTSLKTDDKLLNKLEITRAIIELKWNCFNRGKIKLTTVKMQTKK